MGTAKTDAVPAGSKAISNPNFRLWRTDTRAIVGGVLLAVCFSATMQLTERIDMAVSGGVLFWFGEAFVCLWFPAAIINFGLLGGLLAACFNPIIAILTGTSPMAPRFFIDNTLYVIPFAVFTYFYLRQRGGFINYPRFLMMCVAGVFCISFAYVVTWVFLFHFSVPVIIGLWALLMLVSIPGSLMGYAFARAVSRSGAAAQ